MVAYSADPSLRDARGDTPLHCAVRLGHAAIVESLLRHYGPLLLVRELNASGEPPLHTAVRALGENDDEWDGSDIEDDDGDGGKKNGDNGDIDDDVGNENGGGGKGKGKGREAAAAGANANADRAGRNAGAQDAPERPGSAKRYRRGSLVHVEREGHADMAELEGLVKPPRVKRHGAAPLSCIETLLEHGADIDAQSLSGDTALHLAVRLGHRPAMALLVGKGCSVRIGDAEGRTAYELAIHLNSGETARYLANLHPGAETQPSKPLGSASSSMAEMDRRSILTAVQGANLAALGKLVRTKVKANLADESGATPLHEAATRVRPRCARLLIARGAQWSARTRSGVTPLHLACSQHGARDIVEMLMRAGAPPGTVDTQGRTPLHYAADRGCAENVRALLGATEHFAAGGREVRFRPGATHAAHFRDHGGRSPLSAAVAAGHSESADILCLAMGSEGVVASVLPDGTSTLHTAASVGSVSCIDVLFKHGADVNARDAAGMTPLHAAVKGRHAQAVARLVHLGAEVDVVGGKRGVTALGIAVSDADLACVEALIAGGASASVADRLGVTPVHVAARTGNVEVLTRLLHAGPDVSLRTAEGSTAADLAKRSHQLKCSELIEAYLRGDRPFGAHQGGGVSGDVVKSPVAAMNSGDRRAAGRPRGGDPSLLMSRDHISLLNAVRTSDEQLVRALAGSGAARLNASDPSGVTALHEAAFIGHVHIVGALLSAGAPPNQPDRLGQTALHYAAQSTVSACVQLLLTGGALADVQDGDGWSALAVACARGDARTARILVEHGPQMAARTDKEGFSPLHRACEHGHASCVEVLAVHYVSAATRKNDPSSPSPKDQAKGKKSSKSKDTGGSLGKGGKSSASLSSSIGIAGETLLALTNAKGDTPAHVAAANNAGDCLKVLFAAEKLARGSGGDTGVPPTSAAASSVTGIAEIPSIRGGRSVPIGGGPIDTSRLGIAYMADARGNLPVHVACEHDADAALMVIAEHAPETLKCPQANDRFPLHVAAARGSSACVSYLISPPGQSHLARAVSFADQQGIGCSGSGGQQQQQGVQKQVSSDGLPSPSVGGAFDQDGDQEDRFPIPAPVFDPINPLDADKCTPLHLAARFGHDYVIRALLGMDPSDPGDGPAVPAPGHGVDIRAKDSMGQTAYEVATHAGRAAVTRLLAEIDAAANAGGATQNATGGTTAPAAAGSPQRPTSARARRMGRRMRELHGLDPDGISGFTQPGPGRAQANALAALMLEDLRAGNLGALTSKLKHGAPAHCPDPVTGWTLLHEAASLGAAQAVELLLKHDGQPAHQATGRVTTGITWLLEGPAARMVVPDIDDDDDDPGGGANDAGKAGSSGTSRQRSSSTRGTHIVSKTLLVPNLTPLHLAACLPDPTVLSLLLARMPAAAALPCGRGWTPLLYACELGTPESVSLLINAAPEIGVENGGNGNGKASGNGGKDGAKSGARTAKATSSDSSLDGVTDATGQRGGHGETAGHVAAGVGRKEILELLGQAGLDLQAKDARGETPLFYAARFRGIRADETIEFLLHHK